MSCMGFSLSLWGENWENLSLPLVSQVVYAQSCQLCVSESSATSGHKPVNCVSQPSVTSGRKPVNCVWQGSTFERTAGGVDPNDPKSIFKDLDLDVSFKLPRELHDR